MRPIRNAARVIILSDGRLLAIAHEDSDGPGYSLLGYARCLLRVVARTIISTWGTSIDPYGGQPGFSAN
jgi:hypothetical protein